jgi:hypothetical protein
MRSDEEVDDDEGPSGLCQAMFAGPCGYLKVACMLYYSTSALLLLINTLPFNLSYMLCHVME